jgi:adenylate cyclase
MVISRTKLATAKMVFWFIVSWTLCSMMAYRMLRTGGLDWGEELVVITGGMIIGMASAAFELFAVPRLTRHYGAGAMVVMRALGYILLLAAFVHVYTFTLFGMVSGRGVTGFIDSERYRNFVSDGRFILGVLGLTLMSFVISFVWQVNRMLGPGILFALLFGRYRRPVTEERIFMFLDMKDSTAIAERLGDVRFNALKNDFYHDLSEPVLQTRGRIYEYVGDEVVITWNVRDGLRAGNCVRCFFLIDREVRRRRHDYLARYGVVPHFKAALHGGPVVTSEIGDLRKGIVHSGDTMNTTARIEALCRPLGQRLLISASLLERLPEDLDLKLEDLGFVPLRGKETRMHIFGILGPRSDAPATFGVPGATGPVPLSELKGHGGGQQ